MRRAAFDSRRGSQIDPSALILRLV